MKSAYSEKPGRTARLTAAQNLLTAVHLPSMAHAVSQSCDVCFWFVLMGLGVGGRRGRVVGVFSLYLFL